MGILGLALWACSLLVQRFSTPAMEYLLIVTPALLFPTLTFLRSRRTTHPFFTYPAINIWCVAAYAALAYLTHANKRTLVVPLAIALAASGVAALLAIRSKGAKFAVPSLTLITALAVAALSLLAPSIWNQILTRRVHIAAPDVDLTMRDGTRVRLRQLCGNVVVLNFWGVWCGPCVQEMPELDMAARRARTDAPTARFFAVNSAIGGEDQATIARFLALHPIAVPVAYDLDQAAYRAFGIHGLPTTVIIDPRGVIRRIRVGFASTADFKAWLASSIDELAHAS